MALAHAATDLHHALIATARSGADLTQHGVSVQRSCARAAPAAFHFWRIIFGRHTSLWSERCCLGSAAVPIQRQSGAAAHAEFVICD
jgi:hypothetical protein